MATGTIILPVIAAMGDPTNPPGLAFTAANRPYLAFNDTADELCLWAFQLPAEYASAPQFNVVYSSVANSGTFMPSVEVMAVADAADLDTDAWDTANAASATTVPGTIGLQDTIQWSLTNDGSPSAMAASGYVALRLRRDVSGDNHEGDVYVWACSLTYTTT